MSSTLSTNRSNMELVSTNIPGTDLTCCSFHSWSVPNFFPQVDLNPFLLQKMPFCTLLNALGVILLLKGSLLLLGNYVGGNFVSFALDAV